jgi:GMP synthase-like glutamine amidotransferase
MATFLVLQHIACEPPAAFEDELLAWGAALDRIEVDEGEPLPDWRGYAGIIAMGGPMGAYEDERLPWLAAEKRLIADAVRAGTPYWGVCLGAQLLAASLGARAFTGPEAEVGLLGVRLTDAGRADPVFGTLPEEFVALQWHADTYDLPAGAVRLAGSDAYPQQAFTVQNAYAMQFHLEVSRWSCSIASAVREGSASSAAAATRRSGIVAARASRAKRPSQRTAARSYRSGSPSRSTRQIRNASSSAICGSSRAAPSTSISLPVSSARRNLA